MLPFEETQAGRRGVFPPDRFGGLPIGAGEDVSEEDPEISGQSVHVPRSRRNSVEQQQCRERSEARGVTEEAIGDFGLGGGSQGLSGLPEHLSNPETHGDQLVEIHALWRDRSVEVRGVISEAMKSLLAH